VTNDDGSVDKVNLAYVDVRFSNICNLRCRTCGPELSSAWHDDAVALKPNHSLPRVVNINKTGKFWDELVQYLDKTEEVMFAGGESLITDEHYRILDYLIANDKTDVKLKYTTNFTNFYYKNRNLFDLWLKFDTVHVSASLDGSYKRGEYLRKGMVWEDVVSNRKRMILEVPFVQFDVSATVSLINILHLPDFNREWVNERLVNVNGFRLNLLTEPQYLSIRTLPYNLKARAIEKVLEHIDWLEDNGADSSVVNEWDGILQFMEKHDTSDLLSSFKTNTMSVDRIRSESFLDVFPELGELYDVGR
jgi:sulfatase maturation enzyme AslB (radical SAM superfamily)